MPQQGVVLSLDNRVALVSGGSRGIGAAIVRLFVQAGGRVVFNYRKASEQAEQLATECGPDRCFAMDAELSTPEAAGALVDSAIRKFGRLDVVIANHGVWPPNDVSIERM